MSGSERRFEGFGPDALRFLQALDFHQSREWFAENRELYETQLRAPLIALCEEMGERAKGRGLDLHFDAKKGPFRINRDVRFSNDKRPYNRHVSAVLSPDGTKKSFGVLYVHIGLERSFFAAGYWALPKDELNLFRRHIVTHPERYRELLEALASANLQMDTDAALKRLPRGWDDPDDEEVAGALRLRGFTVHREVPNDAIHEQTLLERLDRFASDIEPLLRWGAPILR